MGKLIVNNPSPVGVQGKDTRTRHAGLLSIKAANTWIKESLKRPDPKMYFHNLIVQYENTVLFASSNVGKSILATQIAEDIAKTEDFDGDVEKLGLTPSTYSYLKGETEDTTMDMNIISAAEDLKEGDVSSVIEIDGVGYYVIRLDKDHDEDASANKRTSLQQEAFTALMESWKEDIDWKVDDKAWEKVKFDSLFKAVEKETDETSEEATEESSDKATEETTEATENTEAEEKTEEDSTSASEDNTEEEDTEETEAN